MNPNEYFPSKVNESVRNANSISLTAKEVKDASYPSINIGPWMCLESYTEKQREEVVIDVLKEARESGSFHIVGHGIDVTFFDRLDVMTKNFFSLSLEEKMKFSTGNVKAGYVPNQFESVSSIYQGAKDNEKQDLREIFSRIYPPNHPDNIVAPHLEVLDEFITKLQPVEIALNKIFTAALNKSNGLELPLSFLQEAQAGATGLLRSSRYPAMPSEYDDAIRLMAHSDWSTSSILHARTPKGLEEIRGGEWVDVPLLPGQLHVVIGEVLAIWSNELFANNVHRVSNQATGDRISFAYFVSQGVLDESNGIEPIAPEGETLRFPRVSCGSHVKDYLATLLGEETAA